MEIRRGSEADARDVTLLISLFYAEEAFQTSAAEVEERAAPLFVQTEERRIPRPRARARGFGHRPDDAVRLRAGGFGAAPRLALSDESPPSHDRGPTESTHEDPTRSLVAPTGRAVLAP